MPPMTAFPLRVPMTDQPLSFAVGDLHRVPVRWNGGDTLGVDRHTPVAFRITIQYGSIYYLEFE